jgi:hypothetical protein
VDYGAFLASKRREWTGVGIDPGPLPDGLFPFQAALTRWALRKGRAALWADTGLGKTRMQVAWAAQIPGRVLILAPLAVAPQTIAEAARIGVRVVPLGQDGQIEITNYEQLHHVDPSRYAGVVSDESSILKTFMGVTKRKLLTMFAETRYRLACTATPAPNDHLELGNHAAFLGIMPANEMISRWFINDPMEAGNYRLKAHGARDFWRWVASWAMSLGVPSDLGFEDDGFILPPLDVRQHSAGYVEVGPSAGLLFADMLSATNLHETMRASSHKRAEIAAAIIAAEPDEPWLIWCHTDYDADALRAVVPDLTEVRGSDPTATKERRLTDFSEGRARVLLTKPRIAGFGMNWQHCARIVFLGLSYSYEQFYQAVRRCWRFGQTRPVIAHVISAENEYGVLEVLQRKQAAHESLKREMIAAAREDSMRELGARKGLVEEIDEYAERGHDWTLWRGDAVRTLTRVQDESVGLSVFSPPFSNLYIYSDALADMGNAANHDEFFEHFGYLADELLRVTITGRVCAIHCKDLPLYKGRDGAAGLYDFPGQIIRTMSDHGWTFHSRVTIWKDPVIEMQRTKNHGLLYKQLRKDSSASRQGMADYVIAFRKWGEGLGDAPVTHTHEEFPLDRWQAWASPIWTDIRQTNVLQYRDARSDEDERHICPLQLDVIERCVRLWSNPGDTILSPFAGIGSEGYVALKHGRKFVGVELKPEYFAAAVTNLRRAGDASQPPLFAEEAR